MRYVKKSFWFVALVSFCLSPLAYGQEASGPIGISVNVFQVAPGMEAQFEEVSMKFKAAADKVEGIPSYFGYSSVTGNNGFYGFASPFNSFTELGTQRQILAEVYEPEELAKINELFRASVVSTDSYIVHPRPDLSIAAPEMDGPPEITLSISIKLNPGMVEEFEAYAAKLVEATKATDKTAYWSLFEPGIGAGGLWGVRVNTSWTNMDTPGKTFEARLTEHFGKRSGENIFEDGQACIESMEYSIQRYRPTLSHVVAPAA